MSGELKKWFEGFKNSFGGFKRYFSLRYRINPSSSSNSPDISPSTSPTSSMPKLSLVIPAKSVLGSPTGSLHMDVESLSATDSAFGDEVIRI
ncbi:hypothetical protein HDU91_005496, partial [Kappamyces sp. JEL0680]